MPLHHSCQNWHALWHEHNFGMNWHEYIGMNFGMDFGMNFGMDFGMNVCMNCLDKNGMKILEKLE
jgi:hypothetical protein